jgi:spore coat protein CotH
MNPRLPPALMLCFAGFLIAAPAAAQFGFGGGRQDIELVERYDQDGDGYLSRQERDAYRYRGRTLPPVESATAATAAPELTPDDVVRYGDESLYDPGVLRTLFIDFEYADWESELDTFYGTDVEIPATVTVDGVAHPGVGIRFRGNTSFRNVPTGRKRGLNLSVDFIDDDQRLLGYRTLNLLNAYGDPTFLRQVLYLQIANAYYPAPKANFVRVAINGQDWGVYVNVQQFNSDFTREAHDTNEARWRIQGSFSSRGGLEYLGDSVSSYRYEYDIKNKDTEENWAALMELTRVLNRTPPDDLVAALDPIFDIDEALWFLAVDNALQNSDGYWARNSDYSVYRDEDGRFHVTAYDANEALREGGQMGRRFGGGGASGARLSPLEGAQDRSKALLYSMLRVPELRARYLEHVRDVAENWLDWERIEPIANAYRELIGEVVAADRRKLYSTSDFELGIDGPSSSSFSRGGASGLTLQAFFEQRQAFLLDWLDANAGNNAL